MPVLARKLEDIANNHHAGQATPQTGTRLDLTAQFHQSRALPPPQAVIAGVANRSAMMVSMRVILVFTVRLPA